MSSSSYTEFNSSMFLSNLLDSHEDLVSTLTLDENQKKVKNMPIKFTENTKFFFLEKSKYSEYTNKCLPSITNSLQQTKTKISESEFINNYYYCYNDLQTKIIEIAGSNTHFRLQFDIDKGDFWDTTDNMFKSDSPIFTLLNDLASQNSHTLTDFNSKIHIGNYKDYIILYTNGDITSNVVIIPYSGKVNNVFTYKEQTDDTKRVNILTPNSKTTTSEYKGVNDIKITQHPTKLKFNAYCVINDDLVSKNTNYIPYLSAFDTANTNENNQYTEIDKNNKIIGQRGCYEYSFIFNIQNDTLHELTESELETYLNRCEIYNMNSNCGDNTNCEYCKNIAYRDWYTQNNAKKIPILGNYADSKAEYNRTWIQTCNLGIGIFLLSIGIYYQQTN